ncbi:membrane protein [Azorhizobium oxalatiphilum]|uniref:Membrane protein n=1 Tax=Azorhizobium oxalatiphilum TaxID=980631 RepID=A0A917FB82_9HYPH|nr:OmpA family protein [Azorhizobium oxalatiphilum]GGF66833.1 membrane protein [Azorhizobium oxalatiphilum]
MTWFAVRGASLAALVLCLTAIGGGASAQTDLSNAQIVQGLQNLTQDAPAVTAASLRQAALDRATMHSGPASQRPPLAIQLDKLAQINVQIQFKLNSAIILPESYATIGSVADALHNPVLLGYKFIITGNTDTTGTRQTNLKLSQERADAVMEALTTTFNVNPARLEAVGLGEEALLDSKNSENPINRRVQIFNVGPLR